MKEKLFFKILASIPVILIMLYFIPFLGIILLIFRYYLYSEKKIYSTPMCLFILGLLLALPKGIDSFLNTFKLEKIKIPYLDKIIDSNIYELLLKYGKRLIIVGVIFLIISFIFKNIYLKLTSKLTSGIKNYIQESERKSYEIQEKNDLIIKQRREEANNTHTVYCPKCGHHNVLKTKVGKCEYCRSTIEYKGN